MGWWLFHATHDGFSFFGFPFSFCEPSHARFDYWHGFRKSLTFDISNGTFFGKNRRCSTRAGTQYGYFLATSYIVTILDVFDVDIKKKKNGPPVNEFNGFYYRRIHLSHPYVNIQRDFLCTLFPFSVLYNAQIQVHFHIPFF